MKMIDQRPKIKEVIIVEGKNDTKQILKAVDALTIETRGSALDAEIMDLIERADAERGIIILTDPDYAGEKIRKQISSELPWAKHAFITPKEGHPSNQGSLGVEHADPETIRKALEGKYTPAREMAPMISRKELRHLGLIDCPQARQKREKLGEFLRIGYANGKQLQKRLQLFNISLADVQDALRQIEGGAYA